MSTIRNDAITARLSNGDPRVAAATVGKLSVVFVSNADRLEG
jgi:hypothetical protein